jgi:carbamoyltransferase
MRVLGVGTAHDASVCLYEDGKIIKFYKEERLSRIKRDNNPFLSLNKILEETDSLDRAVHCAPFLDLHRVSLNNLRMIVQKKFPNCYVTDLSGQHHQQHASLAFYNSSFKEAAVIVVDRQGSEFNFKAKEGETIFHASYPSTIKPIYKAYWVTDSLSQVYANDFKQHNPDIELDFRSMYGIVKVYETATTLIGQHILENGKTMGLASYGDKTTSYPDLFVNGTNIPNDYYFGHEASGLQRHEQNYEAVNLELAQLRNNEVTLENMKVYADYAWQVQKQTQEAMCFLIEKAIKKTGCKNIAITGGYGLNVVANNYYIKKFPDVNFYFEPLADDTGNSIGGAMYSYRLETMDSTIYPNQGTFIHGKLHDTSTIKGDSCSVDDIVKLLIDQKSVAVFKGLAEAGPRALGNRSILFDARNSNAKDIVNKIKNREWYRPFAAMVLKEDAPKYFDMLGLTDSKFMTVNFDANELAQKTIPGAIHVDNT